MALSDICIIFVYQNHSFIEEDKVFSCIGLFNKHVNYMIL